MVLEKPSATKPGSSLFKALLLLPLVYALTLMWWLPEGAKYMPGMVLVVFLLSLTPWARVYRHQEITGRQRLFLGLLWAWILYGIIIYFWKEDSWTELRGFLAAGLYALVLRGMRLQRHWIIGLLVVSAAGFIVLSFWLHLEGSRRIGGHINPIPYATALGSVLVALCAYWIVGHGRFRQMALGAMVVMLVIALFLTQSRGVILPFILIFAVILGMWGLRMARERQTGMLVFGIVVVVVSLVSAGTLLERRLEQTVVQYEEMTQGDWSGSIGVRLQMYRAALLMTLDAPLFGHGEAHEKSLEKLHEEGAIRDSLRQFDPTHYHNQFLDYLVKKGIIGLALFVGLLVAAAQLVVSRSESRPSARGAALGVLTLSAGASMTDVPFHHPPVVYVVVFMVMMLSAEVDSPTGKPVS